MQFNVELSELAEKQYEESCEKEAYTCKYDFSTRIRGRNRKLFIADFDKRVCQ